MKKKQSTLPGYTEHDVFIAKICRTWRFHRQNMPNMAILSPEYGEKDCKKQHVWFEAVSIVFRSALTKRDISSAIHFTNLPDFEHVQIVSTLLHFQADFSKLAVDFINDDVTRLLGELLLDGEAETKSFVLFCIFRPRSHFNQSSPGNINLFPLHIIS